MMSNTTTSMTAMPTLSRLGEGRSVTLDTSSRTNRAKSPFVDVYRGKASDLYDTVTSGAMTTANGSPVRTPMFTMSLYTIFFFTVIYGSSGTKNEFFK